MAGGHEADKRAVLFVVTLASFITPFMGSSINVALPRIGEEFAMNAVTLSWVSISFLLAAAMFLVPFGRIADIKGRKRVFTVGAAVYTVSSFLSGIATSTFLLLAFRVLQGIGSAMTFATGLAILTAVYPPGERGRAIGITVSSVYFGLSVGPFAGGLLTEHLGWRSIFFLNVPLGLIIILTFLRLKGEWTDARGERFDFTGALIYSFTLTAIMCGFSMLPKISGAALLVSGGLGLMAFIKWELGAESPILDVRLFRDNLVFSLSNLAALINYSATFAVTFLLSLYLQYIKGLSPRDAGIVLVAQPVVMAVFSPYAGRLSDRVEPRLVASAGMALTAVGLSLFALLDGSTPVAFIIAGLVIIGFGFALFSSPNTNAVMSSVEKRFYGVASGTLATMRLTGQMFSMGIAALLFALYMGSARITPENYGAFMGSLRTAFVIFAILCLFGTLASMARGRLR